MLRFLILFLIFFSQGFCKERDMTFYCKKALHKISELHCISGIDYIYCINAKKDLKRFKTLKKEFGEYDIVPYRFDAVDPTRLSYKTLFNIGYNTARGTNGTLATLAMKSGKNVILQQYPMTMPRSTYFHQQLTLRDIAHNLNYFSCIFDAYKSKYKSIWIMTDDATILVNPNILTGYLIKLDMKHPGWDVLYTDKDSRDPRSISFAEIAHPIRPDIEFDSEENYKAREGTAGCIRRVGLRTGAESFLLSKRGINKIVQYYKKHGFFIPFEVELQIIPDLKAYYIHDEVVSDGSYGHETDG